MPSGGSNWSWPTGRRTEDMEKDQDTSFDREPWQRLLQERADAPSATADARIRAAARKAIAPKGARWWLPASLAASVLVAVLIVQSQVGREAKFPVVTESDLPAPAATHEGAAAVPERAADATTAAKRNVTAAPAPPRRESAATPSVPPPAPRIGGPEQEIKAASEMERPPADEPAPTPATGITAGEAPAAEKPADASFMQSTDGTRTPEAWYADIAALRKAGRAAEADAELARFVAAYPDWLKQHGQRRP